MILFRSVRYILFVFMLINGASLRAQESKDLTTFFEQLNSFQARFVQTQFDDYGDVVQHSEGVLWIQRPGRFRWEYQQPFAQMMLGNEGFFWLYDQDMEQVTIRQIDDAMASTPLLILSSDVDIREAFNIIAIDHVGDEHWYELIPQSQDGQFETIRMALDASGDLVEMELIDGLSQRINVRFIDALINHKIAAKTFEFEVPEGVDVIGERP